MLNPEQIERLIEIANPDGFKYISPYYNNVVTMNEPTILDPNGVLWLSIDAFIKDVVISSLFLQKCIEGINKIEGYFAQQMKDCIIVIMEINDSIIDSTDYDFKDYNSIDQAKEHALIYILENIK